MSGLSCRYLQAIRSACFGSSPDVQQFYGHCGTRIPRQPGQTRTEMTIHKPITLEPSRDINSSVCVRELTLVVHLRDLQHKGAMASCSHEFLLGSREIKQLARLNKRHWSFPSSPVIVQPHLSFFFPYTALQHTAENDHPTLSEAIPSLGLFQLFFFWIQVQVKRRHRLHC
ncbi:hypothetical protein KVT40_002911 [Elsinoe batatas]|uniref:Uncharacterized protein n=1 Tax=Elsinoe batatas TaxID=2601811 RepID=A0A8K0L799_9PEZI|nr:hypothetical protein KVT40_002911 [Elsinoe batatas]